MRPVAQIAQAYAMAASGRQLVLEQGRQLAVFDAGGAGAHVLLGREVNSCTGPFAAYDLTLAGERLYVGRGQGGLLVLDVAVSAQLRLAAAYDPYATVLVTMPVGLYVYLAVHGDGLLVLAIPWRLPPSAGAVRCI